MKKTHQGLISLAYNRWSYWYLVYSLNWFFSSGPTTLNKCTQNRTKFTHDIAFFARLQLYKFHSFSLGLILPTEVSTVLSQVWHITNIDDEISKQVYRSTYKQLYLLESESTWIILVHSTSLLYDTLHIVFTIPGLLSEILRISDT